MSDNRPQALSTASKKGGKDFEKELKPLPSVGSLVFPGEVLHHSPSYADN